MNDTSHRDVWQPLQYWLFHTVFSPLSYSGNPGVNVGSHWGCAILNGLRMGRLQDAIAIGPVLFHLIAGAPTLLLPTR